MLSHIIHLSNLVNVHDSSFQVITSNSIFCNVKERGKTKITIVTAACRLSDSLKARPHWHSENDLGPSQNVFARPHCNR